MFLDNVFFKNYNENDVAVLACEIIMIGLYNPNYARSGPDHARRFIGSQYSTCTCTVHVRDFKVKPDYVIFIRNTGCASNE